MYILAVEKEHICCIIVIAFIALMFVIFYLFISSYKRKNAEKALFQREQLLRATFNATTDGILIVDKNREIIDANDNFMRLWGIPEDMFDCWDEKKMLECVVDKIVDSETLENWVNSIYASCNKNDYYTALFKDGLILEIYSAPLIYNEAIEGRVWSFRDITERKKADELRREIKENTKLLSDTIEYDKFKTEFFANISHELRTPLNVLLGTIQLFDLFDGTDTQPAKERFKKYITIMRQNCLRLVRLVNNLIDITKIDSGFYNLKLRNYNIVSLVEEITLSVAPYIENKGITVVFDTDAEERLIACDADKIERILLNLLSNAVKFTPCGGRIDVCINDMEDNVLIKVKDTGIGIPRDKHKIIFERFRQADQSLIRNNEGSGIGLSLVKLLVELHGGTIELDSQIGMGSEFIVRLPAKAVTEGSEDLESEYTMTGETERISIEFSDIYMQK